MGRETHVRRQSVSSDQSTNGLLLQILRTSMVFRYVPFIYYRGFIGHLPERSSAECSNAARVDNPRYSDSKCREHTSVRVPRGDTSTAVEQGSL